MARFHDPSDWASSFGAIGFSQFYQKGAVKRRTFCQPILLGEEAKKQGVYGFGADLYCPYCNEKFDFVLVEFEDSRAGSSLEWGEINWEEFNVDPMKCPKCGNRELFFEFI